MYCRNCGHEVYEGDKFCENCGAMIRRAEESEKAPADEFGWNVHQFPEHAEETPDEEQSGEQQKKSVEFDWQTDKSEFRGKPGMDEVAFAPYLRKKEEFRGFKSDETIRLEREAAERAAAAAKAAEEEADAQQRKAAEDIEAEERAAAEKRAAAEAEAEKERLRAEEEEIQRRLEIEARAKIEAERRAAEEAARAAAESAAAEAAAEARRTAAVQPEAVAAKDEPEDIIKGKELEEALFSDMRASEKTDGNIDKFYTFNKKNEEFQKLLDKEYEKFSNGRTVIDDKEFEQSVVSVSATDRAADAAVEETGAEKPEHVREMERARAVFFADDMDAELGLDNQSRENNKEEDFSGIETAGMAAAAGLELFPDKTFSETISESSTDTSFAAMQPDQMITDDEPETDDESETEGEEEPEKTGEPEETEAEEEPEEAGEPEETEAEEEPEEVGEPEETEAEEEPEETGEPEETEAEEEPEETGEPEAAAVQEPETAEEPEREAEAEDDDNEEYGDDDEEDHRSGRAGRIVVGILIVVILAELAFLGIRFLAPESSIAVRMDSIADKIVMMIKGDDTSSTQTQTVTAMIERI